MSVTPYIDINDVVMMNIRPTISRIVDTVDDPNPELAKSGAVSSIPVIQVREIESILKINNGDTAVIGGLMQDTVNKTSSGVPILSSIPLLGALFRYQDDEYVKSELVIFIRPVVMHNASLDGDLKDYRKYLQEEAKP
jgi:general secretion pathway protein D